MVAVWVMVVMAVVVVVWVVMAVPARGRWGRKMGGWRRRGWHVLQGYGSTARHGQVQAVWFIQLGRVGWTLVLGSGFLLLLPVYVPWRLALLVRCHVARAE